MVLPIPTQDIRKALSKLGILPSLNTPTINMRTKELPLSARPPNPESIGISERLIESEPFDLLRHWFGVAEGLVIEMIEPGCCAEDVGV